MDEGKAKEGKKEQAKLFAEGALSRDQQVPGAVRDRLAERASAGAESRQRHAKARVAAGGLASCHRAQGSDVHARHGRQGHGGKGLLRCAEGCRSWRVKYRLFARDASKLKMRVRLDDDALPVQVVLVAGEIGE